MVLSFPKSAVGDEDDVSSREAVAPALQYIQKRDADGLLSATVLVRPPDLRVPARRPCGPSRCRHGPMRSIMVLTWSAIPCQVSDVALLYGADVSAPVVESVWTVLNFVRHQRAPAVALKRSPSAGQMSALSLESEAVARTSLAVRTIALKVAGSGNMEVALAIDSLHWNQDAAQIAFSVERFLVSDTSTDILKVVPSSPGAEATGLRLSMGSDARGLQRTTVEVGRATAYGDEASVSAMLEIADTAAADLAALRAQTSAGEDPPDDMHTPMSDLDDGPCAVPRTAAGPPALRVSPTGARAAGPPMLSPLMFAKKPTDIVVRKDTVELPTIRCIVKMDNVCLHVRDSRNQSLVLQLGLASKHDMRDGLVEGSVVLSDLEVTYHADAKEPVTVLQCARASPQYCATDDGVARSITCRFHQEPTEAVVCHCDMDAVFGIATMCAFMQSVAQRLGAHASPKGGAEPGRVTPRLLAGAPRPVQYRADISCSNVRVYFLTRWPATPMLRLFLKSAPNEPIAYQTRTSPVLLADAGARASRNEAGSETGGGGVQGSGGSPEPAERLLVDCVEKFGGHLPMLPDFGTPRAERTVAPQLRAERGRAQREARGVGADGGAVGRARRAEGRAERARDGALGPDAAP